MNRPAPATVLRNAADQLRDLVTRTERTLQRHDLTWGDLAVTNTAPHAAAAPMVWSQYAAAVHPGVGRAVADWLEAAAHDAAVIDADPNALAAALQILGEDPTP